MGVQFENVEKADGTTVMRALVEKVNSPGITSAYIKGEDGKWTAPDDVAAVIDAAYAEQNPQESAPVVPAPNVPSAPSRPVYGQKGAFAPAVVDTPVTSESTDASATSETATTDTTDGGSKN